MKQVLAIALSALSLGTALAETSVGVSIGINQPGVYGQINIGNFPQPRVVYGQPVLISPPARYVTQQPVYLYVPPGHQKNWKKHCGRYNACGQPVYFVQEDWVRERYEEDQSRGHGKGNGHGKDKGNKHGKGNKHD